MSKIWFSSDLHLAHDRAFIYEPRGFHNVAEMNAAIISRFREVVAEEDDLYLLGDLTLKDNEVGMACLNSLPGRKHIIIGNHDSIVRRELYQGIRGFIPGEMKYADMIRYNGYHFFLCHFPAMTGNLERESLKQMTLCLSGHTHSKEKFYQDLPYVYNVAVDAHNCYPVEINEIIGDMKAKVEECKEML